jgi:hypothetical protein
MFGGEAFGSASFGGNGEPAVPEIISPPDLSGRDRTRAFLNDLGNRRGRPSPGHNSIWFLELSGVTIIEPTAFEPDPATHRHDYYYNAVTNTLYRKVVSRHETGIAVAHWQKASD